MGCALSNAKVPIDVQEREYVHCEERRKKAIVGMIRNMKESVLNKNRDKIIRDLGGFHKSNSMGCGLSSTRLPVDLEGEAENREQVDVEMVSNIEEFKLNRNRDKIIEELGGFRKLLTLALAGEKSIGVRFSDTLHSDVFGGEHTNESALKRNRDSLVEELRARGFSPFLISALTDKSFKIDNAQINALRRLMISWDPTASQHIQNVTNNLCDLVLRFQWLQRGEERGQDTYSSQFDWINARLIYDYATTTEVTIGLRACTLHGGDVYSIGVRCNAQAILSQFYQLAHRSRMEPANSLIEEMGDVNGITDGMNASTGGNNTFGHTGRVPQLNGISKYLPWRPRMTRIAKAPEIRLTYPAIDDAVYLFVEPCVSKMQRKMQNDDFSSVDIEEAKEDEEYCIYQYGEWTSRMRDSGWTNIGIITRGQGIPLHVWEYPLRIAVA